MSVCVYVCVYIYFWFPVTLTKRILFFMSQYLQEIAILEDSTKKNNNITLGPLIN